MIRGETAAVGQGAPLTGRDPRRADAPAPHDVTQTPLGLVGPHEIGDPVADLPRASAGVAKPPTGRGGDQLLGERCRWVVGKNKRLKNSGNSATRPYRTN